MAGGQTIRAVRSWTQRLAWYHGYTSKEDWPESEHGFLRHICMDTEKGSSGLSVGTRDGVTSSTHALGGESDANKVAPR